MTSLNYGDLNEVAAACGWTRDELDAWIRKHRASAPSPHDDPERARRILRTLANVQAGDAEDAA